MFLTINIIILSLGLIIWLCLLIHYIMPFISGGNNGSSQENYKTDESPT